MRLQKPHTEANRPWAEAAILRYGAAVTIPLGRDAAAHMVSVSGYEFDDQVFFDLIAYVDRGGYPRWEREVRPAYVTAMLKRLEASLP